MRLTDAEIKLLRRHSHSGLYCDLSDDFDRRFHLLALLPEFADIPEAAERLQTMIDVCADNILRRLRLEVAEYIEFWHGQEGRCPPSPKAWARKHYEENPDEFATRFVKRLEADGLDLDDSDELAALVRRIVDGAIQDYLAPAA